MLTVGPGNPALLTQQGIQKLQESHLIILRTEKHPIASWLKERKLSYESLDGYYDRCEDFVCLCNDIAGYLWNRSEKEDLIYAVPEALTDKTVNRLYETKPSGYSIFFVPGISTPDIAQPVLSSHFSEDHTEVMYLSASDFLNSTYSPICRYLISEIDNQCAAGDLKVKVNEYLDDEDPVFLLQYQDGTVFESRKIPLYQLDRQNHYDHHTALFVPAYDTFSRKRYTFDDLNRIMARLRAPDGCLWDRQQTHESLKPYLIEEAWECIDAINSGSDEKLADELGDLLFQIVFHAAVGSSHDEFTMTDIVSSISEKMIRRHEHVFGETHIKNAAEVADKWEDIKKRESAAKTVGETMNDVCSGFPSLKYASKMLKKAQQNKHFKRGRQVILKNLKDCICQMEQGGKSPDQAEDSELIGRMLFLITELGASCGTDNELILHETVDRFRKNFQQTESRLLSNGNSPENMSFPDLDF